MIMGAIFETMNCSKADVRIVAFDCLWRVADLYYDCLDPFMGEAYNVCVIV